MGSVIVSMPWDETDPECRLQSKKRMCDKCGVIISLDKRVPFPKDATYFCVYCYKPTGREQIKILPEQLKTLNSSEEELLRLANEFLEEKK